MVHPLEVHLMGSSGGVALTDIIMAIAAIVMICNVAHTVPKPGLPNLNTLPKQGDVCVIVNELVVDPSTF